MSLKEMSSRRRVLEQATSRDRPPRGTGLGADQGHVHHHNMGVEQRVTRTTGPMIEHGLRRQLVSRNVALVVKLPTTARRSEAGRSLTVEQANRFLESIAEHRHHTLWRLMLMTGLRPGEATGLTWSDIDFDEGLIQVRRSLKLEHGQLCLTDSLKTTRSRRSLRAHPSAIDSLRAHMTSRERRAEEAGERWSNPDDLVFTTATRRSIDPINHPRVFGRKAEAAGFGHWHPHELRHSTASILSAAGVPLERIADVLGHNGTRMTALVYRHVVSPTIDDAMAMCEALG